MSPVLVKTVKKYPTKLKAAQHQLTKQRIFEMEIAFLEYQSKTQMEAFTPQLKSTRTDSERHLARSHLVNIIT